MNSTAGKLGGSLLSAVLALLIVSALSATRLNEGRGSWLSFTGSVRSMALFVLAGWVLAIPLVIAIDRVKPRRFMLLLFAGTLIGPSVMLFASVYTYVQTSKQMSTVHFTPLWPGTFWLLSCAIGFTASAFYFGSRLRWRFASKLHGC